MFCFSHGSTHGEIKAGQLLTEALELVAVDVLLLKLVLNLKGPGVEFVALEVVAVGSGVVLNREGFEFFTSLANHFGEVQVDDVFVVVENDLSAGEKAEHFNGAAVGELGDGCGVCVVHGVVVVR